MNRSTFPALLLVAGLLGACGGGDADEADPSDVTAAGEHMGHPTAPAEGWDRVDPDEIEQGRLDRSWRTPAEADREERMRARGASANTPGGRDTASSAGPGGAPAGGRDTASSDTAGGETWDDIRPEAVNDRPVLPLATDEGGPSTLRVQVMLDRARFSPGVIDGRWGKNTEKAVYWFQDAEGLEATGEVDGETYERLLAKVGESPPLQRQGLTEEDVSGPFVQIPEDTYEQAELDCLCYESVEEKVAERYHVTPELLAKLNPDVDVSALSAGTQLWVPNVRVAERDTAGAAPVASIHISRDGFYTHALDADGNVIYHFPSTLGSGYDPSPEGEYRVTAIAWDPDFHYQPTLFHEVPDEEPEAMLPPGPNSPVGVVWMALSKPHYGIHGTSAPSTIGYTSSHGCIRLTNWDATLLGSHIDAGVPVTFR